MPVLGLTRLRRHLFARQAAFGTADAAVRAYPFQGVPVPNLNWTDPEGDFGARMNVARPTRGIPDLTASLTAPRLNYNDLTLKLAAFFGGGVDPTGAGTAQTWSWAPDFTDTVDVDPFTYERGSDADGSGGKPNDWFQYRDGILTSLTIDSPEDGRGVLNASMDWLFGHVEYAGNSDGPTLTIPSITDLPDREATPIYLKDGSVYINSDASDVGGAQISDAIHKFTLRLSQEVDQKRWVNGSQEFDLDGYAPGAITIETELVCAKTADTVGSGSESDAWFSDESVDRYLQVAFESKAVAETGTPDVPYSWVYAMPMRYYTRSDGEIGGNETITLVGRAFLDDVIGGFSTDLVNTLAGASLGA